MDNFECLFIEASILGFMVINTWGVKIQFGNLHNTKIVTHQIRINVHEENTHFLHNDFLLIF